MRDTAINNFTLSPSIVLQPAICNHYVFEQSKREYELQAFSSLFILFEKL